MNDNYNIQHFTKRLYGFNNFNYIERLKRLGIDTLPKRLRYKMIYISTPLWSLQTIINNSKYT